MTRVKRGTTSVKTRRYTLKKVRGYRFGRGTKERQANEAIVHAGAYSFAHRKKKKPAFRGLWHIRISAATKPLGLSYSKFVHKLKEKNITINRKMLAGLAANHPDTFKRVFESATK